MIGLQSVHNIREYVDIRAVLKLSFSGGERQLVREVVQREPGRPIIVVCRSRSGREPALSDRGVERPLDSGNVRIHARSNLQSRLEASEL
jgi:hypothetical protein